MADPTPSPSPPECEPSEGQLVLGKYRIVRKVGEGGFGRVYEAQVVETERRVALKIGRSPDHADRMTREARSAAMLQSPHSVRILGIEALENGSPVIIMELLEGLSLREYLAIRGRVEPALALDWALQLARALREAHALGLVHRDLKPSNLFLVELGKGQQQLKLLDFGLARTSLGPPQTTVTGSQMILGSPAYMSPEQIRSRAITPQSDIWSFGIVLHEMLAGRRPFQATSDAGLLAAISADAPEPLTRARPGLPAEIYRFVARCLQKKPTDRFASADALIQALQPLCQLGEARLGRRVGSQSLDPITETLFSDRPGELAAPGRTGRGWAVGVALVGLALGGGIWLARSGLGAAASEPEPKAPESGRQPKPQGSLLAAPVESAPPPHPAPAAPQAQPPAESGSQPGSPPGPQAQGAPQSLAKEPPNATATTAAGVRPKAKPSPPGVSSVDSPAKNSKTSTRMREQPRAPAPGPRATPQPFFAEPDF